MRSTGATRGRPSFICSHFERQSGSRVDAWRNVMKLPRRQFLYLAVGAAALSAVPRTARAQAFPTGPVRLIDGYPPGGSADITARLIGQWLSERLGQPFII